MSLQFTMDTNIRPLVNLSYHSSDEGLEVDTMPMTDGLNNYDSDDDNQVQVCYRESTPFPPQLAAGRAMTSELTQCPNDLSLPPEDLIDSASTFTEPSQELLDWCFGGPPNNAYDCYGNDHRNIPQWMRGLWESIHRYKRRDNAWIHRTDPHTRRNLRTTDSESRHLPSRYECWIFHISPSGSVASCRL